jgi:hypothetical protein
VAISSLDRANQLFLVALEALDHRVEIKRFKIELACENVEFS